MLPRILVGAFLLLGITNPVNNNLFDISADGFTFGFSTYLVYNFFKKQTFLPAVFLLVIAWISFGYIKGLDQAFILASLMGYLFSVLIQRIQFLKKSAIWILVAVFLLNSIVISRDLRHWLTTDIPYNNDPGVLLKTYRQVETGIDYYDAYKTAQLGRFAQNIIPGDIWGWRLPTVFYIWKVLPGQTGLAIYVLYLVLAATLLFVAYLIAKKYLDENLAFLSPYLLFPYLHFGARDQMFLETEWWAVFIFIFGLYFLVTRKLFFSTIFFSLTLMIREVYLLPIGLMLIYSIFKQRRLISVFLIPIISFAIFFLYHIYRVNYFIDAWGTLFTARTVNNGIYFLQQTLAFASWEYLLNQFRPFLLFTVAAAIGCLYILKVQKKQEVVFLLLAFLPFPIAFLRFGTTPFNDYWGLIYIPTAIILAPTVLVVFKKNPKYPVHSSLKS